MIPVETIGDKNRVGVIKNIQYVKADFQTVEPTLFFEGIAQRAVQSEVGGKP